MQLAASPVTALGAPMPTEKSQYIFANQQNALDYYVHIFGTPQATWVEDLTRLDLEFCERRSCAFTLLSLLNPDPSVATRASSCVTLQIQRESSNPVDFDDESEDEFI